MRDVPCPSWVTPLDCDDQTRRNLYNAIHQVRHEFEEVPLSEKQSPVYTKWRGRLDDPDEEFVVMSPADTNDGYCKIFAERVYELLGQPSDVTIQSQGTTHTWLAYDGRYYDVETPEGVTDPSRLPVYTR